MTANAPPLLHDRYRITTKLGESRLALVYRAHDERLQRPVLVHLLRPELLDTLSQRFTEEAQRGAQRSHPGLLEVYDTGEVGGRPYMITEDVQGEPLIEHLPLPTPQAIVVLRTIVGAVSLSLAQGAPHPPISSRNVWLLDGGRAVLLENWLLGPRETSLDLAHYRAPERRGGGPPSPATVVYALGLLAWETLGGRRPFTGTTPAEITQAQARQPLPSLSDALPTLYSPGLNRIVGQAAANNVQLRYPTPTDFGRALDLYVDGVTAQTGRLQNAHVQAQPAQAEQAGVGRNTQVLQAAPAPKSRQSRTASLPTPAAIRSLLPRPRAQVALPPEVAPPPVAAVQQVVAQPDPQEFAKQVEREMRKEQRRTGCQRALLRFAWRLTAIGLIILAATFGGSYVYNRIHGYVTGQAQRYNPRGWLADRLPNWDWVDRLIKDRTPDIPVVTSYRIITPLNLRDGPSVSAAIIRQLPSGTVVRALGERQRDDQTREWIKVITTDIPPQQGWIANLPDSVQKQ